MVKDVKIAYIGGGSRGWAWGFMSDLAVVEDMVGSVYLYDIDKEAAKKNEVIGNRVKGVKGCVAPWDYVAVDTLEEALTGADFVIISILPGTFEEMESDVHEPEKYGIYQSVGDTSGPGGIIRALRTVPMFEEIGRKVKQYCKDAWVINYTNPMTVCVRTLYKVFPEIKAFGCCHEVFGTQKLLTEALVDQLGMEFVPREEIKVNVVGVNHFTWLTKAQYKNLDLYPIYQEFAKKYIDTGYDKIMEENWLNKMFLSKERVKFDLFLRFGVIAAAGDRHLAEFCPGDWYLKNPEMVEDWKFALTTVEFRKKDLKDRLERSERLYSGEEEFTLKTTGEEGVQQIRALLGLTELVTNVNIPNLGQIPNLPLSAVVETNACFRSNSLNPIFAGNLPEAIQPLIAPICSEQEKLVEAALSRDLNQAFEVFCLDPNMNLSREDARTLFDKMIEHTKEYLTMYLV